jgi:putative peptidoglycan lipid II flippase
MTIAKAVFTIGGWTVLSRLAGLARDTMLASYLGAGTVADAFFVAFRFPNMFRALFAEGAFNAAFVPLFAAKLEGEGIEAARQFAERAYAVLACLVTAAVLLMELAMPWAIYGLAPGFDDVPGKMALAAELSRITFPYLLFISMVSLQSGVLNALGRFAAAAGTPVLLSVSAMAVLFALAPYTATPGQAAAWGVFAGGISQFLWLLYSMRRAGMTLRLVRPALSPEINQLLRRVVPGALGAGVYQVNLLISTMIASGIANGAVSYLNYADRVNQLPLGVVGIAIGTALLPALSRHVRAGDLAAASQAQNRAIELGLLLTLPAAFALAVIAHPVIKLLFQYGSFTAVDTDQVAPALAAFALGLPATVLIKALAPSFFARHDTRTPVLVAMLAVAVNIALNLALMVPLRHVGMALATALAAWVNAVLLMWQLHRRRLFTVDRRLQSRAWRILLACLGMSLLLWGGRAATAGLSLPGLQVALLVFGGATAYGVLLLGLRATSLAEVKAMTRRKAD